MPDRPDKAEPQKKSAESAGSEQPSAHKPVVADQDKLRQSHLDLQTGAEKDRNPTASTADQKLHSDFPDISVIDQRGQEGIDARFASAAHVDHTVPRPSDSIDYKLIRRAVGAIKPHLLEEKVRQNFDRLYTEALAQAPESLRKIIETAGPVTRASFVETYRDALWDSYEGIGSPETRRQQIKAKFGSFYEHTKDPKIFDEVYLRDFELRAEAMDIPEGQSEGFGSTPVELQESATAGDANGSDKALRPVEALKKSLASLPEVPEGHVRLFRAENADLLKPGPIDHKHDYDPQRRTLELIKGRWYTDSLEFVMGYLSEPNTGGDKVSIRYVDVPIETAKKAWVLNQPENFKRQSRAHHLEYIVPKELAVAKKTVTVFPAATVDGVRDKVAIEELKQFGQQYDTQHQIIAKRNEYTRSPAGGSSGFGSGTGPVDLPNTFRRMAGPNAAGMPDHLGRVPGEMELLLEPWLPRLGGGVRSRSASANTVDIPRSTVSAVPPSSLEPIQVNATAPAAAGFEPLIINAAAKPVPDVEIMTINTAEVKTDAALQPGNQQSKSPTVGNRLATFFDNEFFTGGQRTGFSVAANTLGAKGGLEMMLHPNEHLSDPMRYAAGSTLLGSSAIGLKVDYDVARATQQLVQAEQMGNEVSTALAKRSLDSAQKLTQLTGAITTGLMLPLEAYQASSAFSKGKYGEGSLYAAQTTRSGLLLGSIGYSTAAGVASKGAQTAHAAGLTEKAIELAGMAGKYTKVAKVLGRIAVPIAIATETIDIGVKSYHIASAIGETEEIRQSLIEAEKHAFRPGANPEYLKAMQLAQNKKAYEIGDPQAAEYKHLNLAGYGNLEPVEIQSRIEAELKTLEQRKIELSMQFSDIRSVTTDDYGRITSESPSERELVQAPEGRVNLKMGNHGFGLGEAIMPASYIKYDNAISNVETVDNRMRILHAAKEELTGDANGHVNGSPNLFSYATRYEGVRQAQEAYGKSMQEMEPRITAFKNALEQSGSNITDYLKSINEQREQYDRLQLGDSQSYADAKKQADYFKQEYEKHPKDRLMYGLMLITQTNLAVTLGNEVQSLQRYNQTSLEVKVTNVQTQKEATEGRDEMRRIQNIFSSNQPSRGEPVPDRQLMVTAEVTMNVNHYRLFMKELADAGLPVVPQGQREAEDGKRTYTIGFSKGHFQEYLVSKCPVGQGNDTATIALPSGKIITFAISNRSTPRQLS